MRFLDRYKALLFDMNGTFMFGGDRFGEEEDFYATYVGLGGNHLKPEEVRSAVLATCAGFARDYANPDFIDSFPSLAEGVRRYGNAPIEDVDLIEQVIASHEVGHVPASSAETLRRLSPTHKLAVVSNVWGHSHHWTREIARAGIATAFDCLVFSSEIGSIKPSSRPFLEALSALSIQPYEALFVGDSVERDIRPAKALGMATAWVASAGTEEAADIRITSIGELELLDG